MSEPGGITKSEERILSKQEIETLSSSLFEYCVTLGLCNARKIDRDKIFTVSKRYFVKSGQTVTVNFIVRDIPLITLLTDVIANSWDSLRGIKTEGGR